MPHEIKLYDAIGWGGITADEFTSQIPADATEVTVRINSPGGSVADGIAMYHYLKDHPATITTIVDGYAASAASVVMLAGDVVKVHRASIVMIHDPWSTAVGNADDMRQNAAVLDEHALAIADIYSAATGKTGDELRTMMLAETWMRGEAAIEQGFAAVMIDDETEKTEQAAASVGFARMFAAIEGGKELMSKQKTRKDVEAELVEANAATAAKAEEVETVKADAEAKVEDVEAKAEAVAVERDEVSARLDEAEARLVEMSGAVDAIRAELDEAKAQTEAKAEEVDKAKAALANPAVADAVIADPEAIIKAEADADKAEQEAIADEVEKEPKDEYEAWSVMPAGDARIAFWAANKKVIMQQLEARGKEEQG
jgi:ATP-dependent protease ClpP protease subunit